MSALPTTSAVTLLTQWQVDTIALCAGVAAAGWYAAMTQRLRACGLGWSRARGVLFYTGVGTYLWCTNGFLNAYSDTLMWTWTIQVLTLLLLVPVLLMAGQPIELAAATARHRSLLHRAVNSRVATFLAHPFVGTALVPLLTAVLFFGHVGDLWNATSLAPGLLGLVLIGIGCLIARQLTFEDLSLTSLTVGVMLAVSVLELLTDAVPGIVLRFSNHLQTSHYAIHREGWAMKPLTDQKLSGAILWGVAEMLDLPFMLIVFLRWVRADEREGRRTDLALDHATPVAARLGSRPPSDQKPSDQSPSDQPWWLTDPRLTNRPGLGPDHD